MSASFEKSVKGGTKIKLAPPKSKYVEHILVATHAGEAGVAEIFRALQSRLRDSTWTIVFKSLIIVHLMVREGQPDVTLRYLALNPRKLAISNFSDGVYRTQLLGPFQVQGQNIRNYSQYILDRAQSFKETGIDFVRAGEGRLKKLTVEKGLLRETEAVQHTIGALLKCDLLSTDAENEITLTAFRLLVTDLLVLFYIMNEGVINILEHFFEMSKYDAERGLNIYKMFSKQTNQVVEYLRIARQYETATRLEVPKIKHAPTSLTASLEDYVQDPDFEINRRQYIAQQEAKKGRGGSSTTGGKPFPIDGSKSNALPQKNSNAPDFSSNKSSDAKLAAQPQARGPAPDLIDFFESIEQNQQPMAHNLAAHQANQMSQFQQGPQFQQYQHTNFPQPLQQQQQQQQQQPPQQQNIFPSQQQPLIQQPNFSSNYGQQSNPFPQSQQPPSQLSSQQPQLTTNFTNAPIPNSFTPSSSTFSPQSSTLSTIPQNDMATFETVKYMGQPPQAGALGNNNANQTQTSNPFRQSMLPPTSTGSTVVSTFSSIPSTGSTPAPRQPSTNPFAKSVYSQGTSTSQTSPISSEAGSFSQLSSLNQASSPGSLQMPQQTQQGQLQNQSLPGVSQMPTSTMPLRPAQTGTNPFARNNSPAAAPALPPQTSAAGTNPFRQSTMPSTTMTTPSSSTTWQPGQPTLGGFEQMPTVAVFPRPTGQQGSVAGQQGWQ